MPKLPFALAAILLMGAGCTLWEKQTPAASTPTPSSYGETQGAEPQAAPATEETAGPAIELKTDVETKVEKTSAKTVEVRMTAAGFDPGTVTIKKGDTVKFVNADTTAHWPASAVHPTHAVYPQSGGCIGSAFDACHAVQPGDSWDFTFAHVGDWKFHDHMNTSLKGTVTVNE